MGIFFGWVCVLESFLSSHPPTPTPSPLSRPFSREALVQLDLAPDTVLPETMGAAKDLLSHEGGPACPLFLLSFMLNAVPWVTVVGVQQVHPLAQTLHCSWSGLGRARG